MHKFQDYVTPMNNAGWMSPFGRIFIDLTLEIIAIPLLKYLTGNVLQ